MNLDDVTACFNLMRGIESSMPEKENFWLNGAGKARAHTAIMSACTAYTSAMGQLDKANKKFAQISTWLTDSDKYLHVRVHVYTADPFQAKHKLFH